MSSNVYLRVFGLKGMAPKFVNQHSKGSCWCRVSLGDNQLETVKNKIGGGSLAVNEVTWSTTEGFMKWEMSREEIQNLKNVQPQIKVHIFVQSGRGYPVSMGYVLIDMRDLSRAEIKNQSLKIHGMTGAELTVSAKLVVGEYVKENPTIAPGLAGSVDVSLSGTEGGPSVMSSLAASTDSVRSVLRLALDESKKSDKFVRFSFSVALEDYHHLALLCEPIIEEDHKERTASGAAASGFPQPKRSFWLCWTVFDKMFQSDEFQYGQPGPKRVRDTIKVECPLSALESSIEEANPLRIFLCTQDKLLGVANVPLPAFSREVLENELLTSDSISESGWGSFGPPLNTGPLPTTSDSGSGSDSFTRLSEDVPAPGIAGIKLGTCLTFDDVLEKKAGTAAGVGAGTGVGEEMGEYEGDDFENEDMMGGAAGGDSSSGGGGKAVTFASEGGGGMLDVSVSAPIPPAPTGQGGGGMNITEEGQKEEEEENGDEYADDRLRHFRVSVQAKSMTGFKRPSHVSISFVYPYLGTSSAVRTHPTWVLANSEATIDGGSGTYECVMSRSSLRDKLTTNPLKIAINSKSAMGSNAVGATIVDLNGTFSGAVHSFRCPVTGRSFKSRSEYTRHRHVLLALKATGRIEVTPPVDPVFVRVTDSYIGMESSAEGSIMSDNARMRVMVVVEELGKVGNELAMEVKPGYKMHGGGVYVSTDADSAVPIDIDIDGSGGDGSGGGDSNAIQNPLDRDGGDALTPFEKRRLELMTLEWEGWRKRSEDKWKDSLRDKERMLRKQLEMEAAASLANRADDLRRAHEEAGRLEVRLRTAIEAAEKSKSELSLKEEQMNLRLAQKTSELQLLQKRVRDEAKAKIDSEKHRGDSLASQLATVSAERDRLELRAKNSEKEYESYRASVRSMPESLLREEVAKVKAQLAESRAETERERRIRSETELEKEHFRSQMHRLALALKREREKSNTLARQELEQLRLEFLAREERYVLDGDREELRTIRHELASLRSQTNPATAVPPPAPAPTTSTGASPSKTPSVAPTEQVGGPEANAKGALSALLSTGLYDSQDSLIKEMTEHIEQGGAQG